jgi:hypothetical protein
MGETQPDSHRGTLPACLCELAWQGVTSLHDGQLATVLQLPARPASSAEAEEQTRVAYIG